MMFEFTHQEPTLSLQDAFKQFRNKRKKELLNFKNIQKETVRSEKEKKCLRHKFLEKVKSYIGVPYKKRYHEPESEEYKSKLFLDCCALVRKAQRDLAEDFGFRLGAGNQAYQYDVLPHCIRKEDMKAGDLVFISGTYFNEKATVYPHNMVHVEIWLGEGEKTIGARWKRGKVQIHDSYIFKAESYHSLKYYFKSIDAWLNGVCKSYCPEHSWQKISHSSKFSLFSLENQIANENENEKDIDASDEELEEYKTVPSGSNVPSSKDSLNASKNAASSSSEATTNTNHNSNNNSKQDLPPKSQTPRKPSKLSAKTESKRPTHQQTTSRKFFIGGNNGVKIIENCLLNSGLERTEDAENFFFKWTELRKNINYKKFNEDQQIVNHISNINCLTTKVGLLQTLRDFDRQSQSSKKKRMASKEFFMESYCIHNKSEYEEFQRKFKDGEIWICKPSGRNQGKGIFLITSLDALQNELSHRQKPSISQKTPERIIQRYIANPLLINGYKFDVRAYMLIGSSSPYIVFYHKGYVRLSCVPYSTEDLDLHAHLTNQYVQKKHPSYSEKKEDSVMSFDQFNEYINQNVAEEKSLCQEWIYSVFTPRMKEIMLACFKASMGKLEQRKSTFELLGFDFMVDSAMKVWLIEINVNPALHTNCHRLKEVIPCVVEQTINVALEVFKKRRTPSRLETIDSATSSLEPLYNAVSNFSFKNDASTTT